MEIIEIGGKKFNVEKELSDGSTVVSINDKKFVLSMMLLLYPVIRMQIANGCRKIILIIANRNAKVNRIIKRTI